MEIVMLVVGLAVGALVGWVLRRSAAAQAVAAERAAREQAETEARFVREQSSQFEQTAKIVSRDVLAETTKQLRDEFEQQRSRERETADAELRLRTKSIEELVRPVREKLDAFDQKVSQSEAKRAKVDGEFTQRLTELGLSVELLGSRTTSLVDALKKPSVRGAWGELQLRSVIERAGMLSYCDFVEQVTATDADGRRQRPDVLVKLPGDKLIVVDAKVPLDAFLAAQEVATEEAAAVALERHARQVRAHVNTLGTKRYQDQFDNAPDLVVMFLPNEGIYHGALDADRGLFDYAVEQSVLIATPTTLIALLRAVAYGWTQENLARNARDIAAAGTELHKRLVDFVAAYAKVGKNLSTLVGNYNASIGTLEGRVFPKIRQLEELDARSSREIAQVLPAQLETQVRTVGLGADAVTPDAAGRGLAVGSPEAA